ALGQVPAQPPMIKGEREGEIAYGARSKYVTSARIPHGGRPSPDTFGLTFHVATPLQDSVGVITPSSLHYFATTRGAYLPDIDPQKHTLMIHGLVDRPLTFTMDDLKRLPSVTRLHFIECAGNRPSRRAKTVITRPSGDQRLPGKGFYEISGLAWSGGGAIKQVEVSTDGGKKWNKAQFQGTPQRMAHARFVYQWNWDGNETEIMSRCVDEIGQAQPTREQI